MRKFRIFGVIILVMGVLGPVQAQNSTTKYEIMPVPESMKVFPKLKEFQSEYEKLKTGAIDLTTLLPKNHKTDGTVDYTQYIQQGLDKYDKVIFPNFPIQINDSGLAPRSNTTLLFPPKSKLILKPSNKGSYEIIRLHRVQNVALYFPKIDGNRNNHLGQDGEWGYGISVYSSRGIKILNPTITDCWGDGICISQLANDEPAEDIQIYYPVIEHNRRNGITIASAKNLTIVRPVISNTFGASPMAAIDIEPSSQYYILENIVIESPLTYHSRYGIVLALTHMSGRHAKPVNITINNHHDMYSAIGFRVVRFRDIYKKNPPLKGEIHINNPRWENSNMQGLKLEETFDLIPNIYFTGDNEQVTHELKGKTFKKILKR